MLIVFVLNHNMLDKLDVKYLNIYNMNIIYYK